jgi:DNA-directed RNA polymerase subunit F
MTIKEVKALSMAESLELIENLDADEEKKKELKGFINKFVDIKPESAKKLRAALEELNSIKIKQEHIVKIIDLLPETASELNKIFIDVSLNEDETNKILEIVKKQR